MVGEFEKKEKGLRTLQLFLKTKKQNQIESPTKEFKTLAPIPWIASTSRLSCSSTAPS
jgi:hypothetical protein